MDNTVTIEQQRKIADDCDALTELCKVALRLAQDRDPDVRALARQMATRARELLESARRSGAFATLGILPPVDNRDA